MNKEGKDGFRWWLWVFGSDDTCTQTDEFINADAKLRKKLEQMEKIRDDELNNLPEPGSKKENARTKAKRKVLNSLIVHWDGLLIFVDNPEIPMDNNTAERLLRNQVLGRKNYYGSGAEWSAGFAASFFTVFQTLIMNKINTEKWLLAYFQSCAENGGKPPADFEKFLPWNLSEELKEKWKFKSGGSP